MSPQDRLDAVEELERVILDEAMDRHVHGLPAGGGREGDVVGGGYPGLHGEGHRNIVSIEEAPDLAKSLGAGLEGERIFHLIEAHAP